METASFVLVEVELGVDEEFGWAQLSHEEDCDVFVIQITRNVDWGPVVFILVVKPLEVIVLIQDLATVSQFLYDFGE